MAKDPGSVPSPASEGKRISRSFTGCDECMSFASHLLYCGDVKEDELYEVRIKNRNYQLYFDVVVEVGQLNSDVIE